MQEMRMENTHIESVTLEQDTIGPYVEHTDEI
jgi:hypothetical protein